MEFFVHYLPSLRVPVDVYWWYRSDLSPTCHQSKTHHPGPWKAGGKSGAKMLPCVSLANSCQLARRGILRVNVVVAWVEHRVTHHISIK